MNICGLGITIFMASASAFSFQSVTHQRTAPLHALPDNELSRGAFLSSTCSAILSSMLMPSESVADETELETKPSRTIQGCEIGADDCVSTSNIKDAKGSYSPPWTFEVSPDEAFARIKGVLKSDDGFVVTEVDDVARYIRAYAKRITIDQDEVEFLVKGDDKVVLYKSSARKNGSISDFGANRKRIDGIRKRGAVFDLMGGGMTADSFDGGGAAAKGNSPLGQLKAFYGLQRGEGFESVFEEEE
eukprot:CAMPEP_0172544062 /NCGR_PEP_ID=MMETSP1067-20121228/14302_1 /TAXON_ID=265564 ORGANISM="Thalassiosira punctigera, Strain Tpunct2005C2" /NCGR_SAMPLE_ID=MMETSP1067 /ASSEMBLY_ACC=CAM_ASM_000444 /LENGTH=244 /DNA_ID=CAMNT_0013330561 /DNA_START=337 /DNA_END=1071 /DNA_ORIENTATION=-